MRVGLKTPGMSSQLAPSVTVPHLAPLRAFPKPQPCRPACDVSSPAGRRVQPRALLAGGRTADGWAQPVVLGRAKAALKMHFRRPTGCVSPALGRRAELVLFDGHLLSHPLGTGDQAPSALSRPLPCLGTSKTNQGGSRPEGMSGCLLVMLLSEGSRELINFIKEQPRVPWDQMRLCLKSNSLIPQPEANRAPGVRL